MNTPMTSVSPKPVLLDDFELLRVASTPRARLFPVPHRPSAFAPLILVCGFLPLFQLLARPTLNEEASLWGLRSLAVCNARTWTDLREPGVNEQGQPLLFQPPLAAWSNAVVYRLLGPSHLLSSALVSLIATGIGIGLTSRLAWRMGGTITALIAALLMCSHPQVLESAIAPGSDAIGLCLMLLSVYTFQRHLEGTSAKTTWNLLISAIAFGLSILTVGSLSLILPMLYVCHGLNQRAGLMHSGPMNSLENRYAQGLPVLRSTLLLIGIGFLVGGWWEFVMWARYGQAFWNTWIPNLPVVCQSQGTTEWRCDLLPLLQPEWREWFRQNALLIAWLSVGLERSWHELRSPSSELTRRRSQLVMFWWLIAFAGRVLAEIAGTQFQVNTAMWNLALLAPTILLATIGFGTLIERGMTRRGEFCLIVLLVGLTIVSTTNSWTAATVGMASIAAILLLTPMVIPSLGQAEGGWDERIWRRQLQAAVYGSLFACVFVVIHLQYSTSDNEDRLTQLRAQIASLPDVRRITFLVTRDPVPVTLRYLLRCRWPKAEMVTSDGWDEGLTREMNEESGAPRSRFLILEWTRRDLRLSADTGQAWQISPVGDPMRFHGRRLSLTLIGPRT